MGRAQRLKCRQHYLLWLFEQFQEDPAADLGEMTMNAYSNAWHKRRNPAKPHDLAAAEAELRKLSAQFVQRAEQRI